MPNKTSTRLYGTKTKWKNSPLAIPNNSTIFALIFHILALRPLSTRLGAFLSPETFSHIFFPKFFPIRPRRLFSVFLVRKIMGAKGSCRSPNGGGVPFRMLSTQQRSPIAANISESLYWSNRGKFSDNRGKNGQKWINFCSLWCFLGIFGDQRGQNLRYI